MTTIADIQAKVLAKMENKFKGGASSQRLKRLLSDVDADRDGFVSFKEFQVGLGEMCLAADEAAFLFQFWDTMAGQREAQGAVEINLIVSDLLGSAPTYTTGFRSGDDGFKAGGNKSNRSSVAGGIFGGGAYSADAEGMPPASYRAPAYAPPTDPAAAIQKPRGNQSSIEGGIFGGMDGGAPLAPQPSNRANANRSNQSSIQGGIFGDAPCAPPSHRGSNRSNQSSIQGGIFG